MLKAAVASIGSVCIQRTIKLHPHGEGVIGRDPGCQHCLYTYRSHSNWPGFQYPWAFFCLSVFLSHLFVFQKIYSTLSLHLPLSETSPLILVSSFCPLLLTQFVRFTQSPHASSHSHSVLHAATFLSIMLLPPSPPSFPRSQLSNGFMKRAGEMMREIAILMVWHQALSQAPLINEFKPALALWWTMLIRQRQPKQRCLLLIEVRSEGWEECGHAPEREGSNFSVCGLLVCVFAHVACWGLTWYPLWGADNGGLLLGVFALWLETEG